MATQYSKSAPQNVTHKKQISAFWIKLDFYQKSLVQSFLVWKLSGKVVGKSLAYQSVDEWSVEDIPYKLKFWLKVSHLMHSLSASASYLLTNA